MSELCIYSNQIGVIKYRPKVYVGRIKELIENNCFVLDTRYLVGSDYKLVDDIRELVSIEGNDVALSPSIKEFNIKDLDYYDHAPYFIDIDMKKRLHDLYKNLNLSDYGIYYFGEEITTKPTKLLIPYFDAEFADRAAVLTTQKDGYIEHSYRNGEIPIFSIDNRIYYNCESFKNNILATAFSYDKKIKLPNDTITFAEIISALKKAGHLHPISKEDNYHDMFVIPDSDENWGCYNCKDTLRNLRYQLKHEHTKQEYSKYAKYFDTAYLIAEDNIISIYSTNKEKIYTDEDYIEPFKNITDDFECTCEKDKCICSLLIYTNDLPVLYSILSQYKRYFSISHKFKKYAVHKTYVVAYFKAKKHNKSIKIVFYDTRNVLNCTYKEYCDSFKLDRKPEEYDRNYGLLMKSYDRVYICSVTPPINKTHRTYYLSYLVRIAESKVSILKEGFERVRMALQRRIGIDIRYYLGISQIAGQYLEQEKVYEGVKKVSPEIMEHSKDIIVGGQVMTANNKSFEIDEELYAIDVNSLYPYSMMNIKGYPKGEMKSMTKDIYINGKYDWFIAKFKILNAVGERKFPSVGIYDPITSRRMWTNNIANRELYLNPTDLDMIKQHYNAEVEFIEGYYWDEGFNTTICNVIDKLYNIRLEYKNDNNKLEHVFKVLMNCCYGKSIEKINTKTTVSGKLCNKCLLDAFEEFKDNIVVVSGSSSNYYTYADDSMYDHMWYEFVIETNKDSSSYMHCGSMILSESKKFMHQNIDIVQDNLYYTDTDSLFINLDGLRAMKEHLGTNIGTFHPEFSWDNLEEKKSMQVYNNKYSYCVDRDDFASELDPIYTNIYADKGIFLGSKSYCLTLRNRDRPNVFTYRIRMSGVSSQTVIKNADKMKLSVMELYKKALSESVDLDIVDDNGHTMYTKTIFTQPAESAKPELVEAESAEPKPAEPELVEAKSVEAKSVEAKSAKPELVEIKLVEIKSESDESDDKIVEIESESDDDLEVEIN